MRLFNLIRMKKREIENKKESVKFQRSIKMVNTLI